VNCTISAFPLVSGITTAEMSAQITAAKKVIHGCLVSTNLCPSLKLEVVGSDLSDKSTNFTGGGDGYFWELVSTTLQGCDGIISRVIYNRHISPTGGNKRTHAIERQGKFQRNR